MDLSRRMPPLTALRAFAVAARHLNVRRAAAELAVTPGAVSQQIRQLEDHLGCALFHRNGRRLALTPEGQACLPGLTEGFEHLRRALDAIPQLRGGPLTVSVAPSFAAKWLVPRLERFRDRHADIDVRVSASMQLVDFSQGDIDCAIRYGAGRYAGLEVEKLLEESVVPVCSPRLLKRRDAISTPADLARLTLIHDESPDQDPSCPDWPMWLRAAGVDNVNARRGLRLNQSSLVIEAAISGRGVALAKGSLAADDIAAGNLVTLFGRRQPLSFAYFFVAPPSRAALPKVRSFRAWLSAEAGRGKRS
jgi:LysR family glycine cleavage system transcriptional activator